MSWLHLLWDIASVWAICAGCLMIFITVLKAQRSGGGEEPSGGGMSSALIRIRSATPSFEKSRQPVKPIRALTLDHPKETRVSDLDRADFSY